MGWCTISFLFIQIRVFFLYNTYFLTYVPSPWILNQKIQALKPPFISLMAILRINP